MKHYVLIFLAVLLAGYGCKVIKSTASAVTAPVIESELTETTVKRTSTESIDKDNSDFVPCERDVVRFSYIESVENYRVTGVLTDYINETNYGYLELTFHNLSTGKEFTVRGGSVSWQYFLGIDTIPDSPVRLHYPNIVEQGMITAPDNTPFFFADIDFDGANELITGHLRNSATQRDVGRFTTIYKIVDGLPQDVTEEFESKSYAFSRIEAYFFMINPERKEILYYHDGGAINFGWDVYKFSNGEYSHRYIRCFNPHDDSVHVEVIHWPLRSRPESFTVDKATFDREKWNY